jgi:hypothetical protein
LLQDQDCHQFADQCELLGIPNFWNVVSNLPFIAVGAVGLLRVRRDATTTALLTYGAVSNWLWFVIVPPESQ